MHHDQNMGEAKKRKLSQKT